MLRKVFISFLAALLLSGSGCFLSPKLEPVGTVSISLDGVKKTGALTTGLLDEVVLQLPPVTEAGYVWEVFLLDHRFVKVTSHLSPPNADGVQSMTFITTRVGRTRARFMLVKANVTESAPIDSQEILLTVEG